ncbi:MAG: iron-sulfur cluster assembly scaffold protein [Desulfovibrionales bacterium]|nr:iron-sulfur cluster assembly scaffold protein [Desulfovibrionales bacterium]
MGEKRQEKEFDFWNDHSLEFLEMAMKRDFQETVAACDGYGKSVRPGCRDTIEFFLMEKGGRIDAVSYDLSGCIFSHACANTVIKLAKGAPVEKALAIKAQDIVDYLKTLPEAEVHCADHALRAFHRAVRQISGDR